MVLRNAVVQLISSVGENRELGLALINRYVHEGLLDLALLAPGCSTLTEFGKADCERRTIHAAFRPAEAVWVEPREDGQHFVRRSQFAKLTSPTATATAAHPRLSGGPEPSQSPQDQRQPQQPTNEREPNSGDVRASKRRRNSGGGAQRRRARVVLKRLWPNGYPTEEEVSTPDLLERFGAEYDRVEGKANPPSKLGIPSPATVLREVGRKDD